MRTRHFFTASASAVALAAALMIAPTAAQASTTATGYARCPAGSMCVFTGVNGTGVMATFKKGDADLSDRIGPRGMDDNIASVWNRTTSAWGLFNNKGYTGGITLVLSKGKATIEKKYRDKASSLKNIYT